MGIRHEVNMISKILGPTHTVSSEDETPTYHRVKIEALKGVLPEPAFSKLLLEAIRQHGAINIEDPTSAPAFSRTLGRDLLDLSLYALVRRRTDINSSLVTLDCQILFPEGVMTLVAHWTAYKDIREDEIFSTLYGFLEKNELLNRTFLELEGGASHE